MALVNKEFMTAFIGASIFVGLFIATPAYAQSPQGTQAPQPEKSGNFCARLLSAEAKVLAAEVSALVVTAPDAAADINNCVCPADSTAIQTPVTSAQAKAIGAGLAAAVVAIRGDNPAAAEQVASVVANSCNAGLKTAYLEGTGEATAAVAGGAGATAPGGSTPAGGPSVLTLSVGASNGGTSGGTIVSPN